MGAPRRPVHPRRRARGLRELRQHPLRLPGRGLRLGLHGGYQEAAGLHGGLRGARVRVHEGRGNDGSLLRPWLQACGHRHGQHRGVEPQPPVPLPPVRRGRRQEHLGRARRQRLEPGAAGRGPGEGGRCDLGGLLRRRVLVHQRPLLERPGQRRGAKVHGPLLSVARAAPAGVRDAGHQVQQRRLLAGPDQELQRRRGDRRWRDTDRHVHPS
mmetsp:Transcript_35139/g.91855  ORF Transcript_35139/g.91855 Transcript_35139/m.91855 type:complete len:212 (+) Transcript_35139:1565-2200(+)